MAVSVDDPTRSEPPPPPDPRRRYLTAAVITLVVAIIVAVVVVTTNSSGHHQAKSGIAHGAASTLPAQTNGSTPQAISQPSSTTTAPLGTSGTQTTILGPNGNPADWPAAQASPPSLDRLFVDPPDFVDFVKTLQTYIDWAYAHPDPALVANYMLSGSSYYAGQVADLTKLKSNGWHPGDLTPTEIDFIKITQPPQPYPPVNGAPVLINGHPAYRGGAVTIVFNYKTAGSFLDQSGKVVQTFPPGGLVAYAWTLAQGVDGRWRIADEGRLNPPGGIASLEHP